MLEIRGQKWTNIGENVSFPSLFISLAASSGLHTSDPSLKTTPKYSKFNFLQHFITRFLAGTNRCR